MMEIISLHDDSHVKYDFPLWVYPKAIQDDMVSLCDARSLPLQFVATAGLWCISTLAGRRYHSDDLTAKNILYVLMVAPVSVGKTPSFSAMCEEPLQECYRLVDERYQHQLQEYRDSLKSKDKADHKDRPNRYIPIVQDATTESLIAKHMVQPVGLGCYYDEAESIFSAGGYKKENDSISFFTQAFNGNRHQSLRVEVEKERVLANVNVNLMMGTQPERLSNVFTSDRLTSGFASRFITVTAEYQQLNEDQDPFGPKMKMGPAWINIVTMLFMDAHDNKPPIEVHVTDDAKPAYRAYNKLLLQEANKRIGNKAESYLIGAEAKLTAYFPRLCQILAILHQPANPVINEWIVNAGFSLYRYYQSTSIAAISGMNTTAETGLQPELFALYNALPDEFSNKQAELICVKLGYTERKFRSSMRNQTFNKLFTKTSLGAYVKV